MTRRRLAALPALALFAVACDRGPADKTRPVSMAELAAFGQTEELDDLYARPLRARMRTDSAVRDRSSGWCTLSGRPDGDAANAVLQVQVYPEHPTPTSVGQTIAVAGRVVAVTRDASGGLVVTVRQGA